MSNLTKGSIEFLTVALETCKFIEKEEVEKESFIDTMRKLLPLLYLKASMAEVPRSFIYDEEPERFVNEKDYEQLRERMEELLGNADQYLTAIHPDIALSDTTVVATISEDIADIYQNLKNFVSIGQLGNEDLMNDALIICLTEFKNYWGTKLLSAQLTLHLIWSGVIKSTDESETEKTSEF